ncbi:MAG: O-antigen ligase family protein [Lentisphaeria bacterium]|nr:O-antigen ligase family protein [Lentisphaeria bacterium]
MQLQFCNGVIGSKVEKSAVFFFMTALIFLYRPVMSAGSVEWAKITIFSEGLYALLALGFVLLRWQTLREVLRNTTSVVKCCIGILLISGLVHWLLAGYYRPEYLGLNLFWGVVPLFGIVYRNELERKLPAVLGLFWLFNVIVCIVSETFLNGMFGITGNWNWSALLLLVTFPFALRCIPLECTGRKVYLALMWIITLILLLYLQSRAIFLCAVFSAGFWCFLKFRKLRIPMICSVIVVIAAGVYLSLYVFPEQTQNFLKGEIRVEIWKGSLDLTRDVPLGVGAASYENALIPYKTIGYFQNHHCTVRTPHPHNEFLYLAGTLGLPGMAAFLVWIIAAVVGAVKEYDTGMMSRKRVLFLLAFLAMLLSSMIDVTFHVWPNGILALLFFGMFAFPGKRTAEEVSRGPANVIGKTVLLLAGFMAICNLIGTYSWEASHEAILRKDNVAARKYAERALLFAPEFPDMIYRSAIEMSMRNRDFSMRLTERLQESPWKDFAHIHALKAQNYALMRQDEKAIPEYIMETQCYPLQILPYFGILNAYGRLGQADMIPVLSRKIDELKRFRNLTEQQVNAIHRNPEYDMHPELIGKKKSVRGRWEMP